MPDAKLLTRVVPTERLMSIDALRGFDMFWIVGADGLVQGLRKISESSSVKAVADQLEHKQWEGFAFEDSIFPLFVFLSGASMVFSLGKSLEQQGLWRTVGKLALRAVLLFVIGFFFYGGFNNKWPDMRLVGVLQRIALSYFFAGLVFCFFGLRGRIFVFTALLAGYWALLTFVPIPDVDGNAISKRGLSARFSEGTNLANYIDRHYLPGRRWDGPTDPAQRNFATHDHDPEGLLSTIPAIATCLLGVFFGMLLKAPDIDPRKKTLLLFGIGAVCIGLGFLWGLQFPIIKKIWTSSFVLVAGGWSSIMLGIFYFVIDVLKARAWAMPFVWIGTNALAIYLSEIFINYGKLANLFVGGGVAARLGAYHELVHAIVVLGIVLIFANFLYRKRIFIRI